MGFTDQSLTLNLGLPSTTTGKSTVRKTEPSLTLSLFDLGTEPLNKAWDQEASNNRVYNCSTTASQYSSPRGSGVSSVGVKRERDNQEEVGDGDRSVLSGSKGLHHQQQQQQQQSGRSDEEDEEEEETIMMMSTHSNTHGGVRKKLRLSKDQSAMLEESFKQHSTLNPKQKQALANQLNLRPRQVEVWFQNRRARTKLKQTEVDCEFLKKCCETLTEENRRLQKEVHELRAIKQLQMQYTATTTSSSSSPHNHRASSYLPPTSATTLTMCPSCERVCRGGDSSSAAVGTKGLKSSHFVYAFAVGGGGGAANPSAGTAC